MNTLMPKTIAASEIQKNYRKIFDQVKRTKEPVIVLTGNKPDIAITDLEYLEDLRTLAYQGEIKDALLAIAEGEKELRSGKTKKAKSLAQLLAK